LTGSEPVFDVLELFIFGLSFNWGDFFMNCLIKINKRVLILAAIVLALVMPGTAYSYQVINKTTSEEIVTRGVVLESINMQTDEGPLKVYVLKADLTDPNVKLDTIIGSDGTFNKNQTVMEMARRTGAVAAINGDFFQMAESGRPIGLAYHNGQLAASPALRNDMYGVGVTKKHEILMEIFGFSGQVIAEDGKSYPLSGINKPSYLLMNGQSSDINALHLYNAFWGTASRGVLPNLKGVTVAVVRNGVVQQVLTDESGVSIPADGFVLQGHGEAAEFIKEHLPVGTKVAVSYVVSPGGDDLLAAVGGQALLVVDGHLPAYFTQNIYGKVARTAVGVSRDGKTLYLVTVERSVDADGNVLSRGMTQEELANFLISIGVWRAVNLDGGGSTTMVARHLGDFEASLINKPQGGSMRSVPDAIGIFSTLPAGKVAGLKISGPEVVLAGTKASYSAKGYDENYNPVRVRNDEIIWSATPAGSFRGNTFMPEGDGIVTINATLEQASGSMQVNVIGAPSLAGIFITPASITVMPGESVPLAASVKTRSGVSFELAFEDAEWSVSNELGSISNGVFKAERVGDGYITVTFLGLSASIPVTVKPLWVDLEARPEQAASAQLDSWIDVDFPKGSVAKPVNLRLAYAGSAAGLPQGCINLGSFTLQPAPGETAEITAPWTLSWEYQHGTVEKRPAILMWDEAAQAWKEQPSKVEYGEEVNTISARVWGLGQFVLVDDQRATPYFKDISKHWAAKSITDMALRGVINGFPDGTFRPDETVTRAQFVKMLVTAMQWPYEKTATSFTDDIPEWARATIDTAVSRGVITGYPDGSFAPDAKITRSEMAVMLDRALGLADTNTVLKYKDQSEIPAYARAAVAKATGAGLLQGADGLFRPNDGASRAETAVVISRLYEFWLEQ